MRTGSIQKIPYNIAEMDAIRSAKKKSGSSYVELVLAVEWLTREFGSNPPPQAPNCKGYLVATRFRIVASTR